MIRASIQALLSRVGRSLTGSLAEQLDAERRKLLRQVRESERRLVQACGDATAKAKQRSEKESRTLQTISHELSRLRAEVRLTAVRARRTSGRAVGGIRIPVAASDLRATEPQPEAVISAIPRESILMLDACPVCAGTAATIVCEYNKLFLLNASLDEDASLYNYALCHDCGVVFARRRPAGPRYAYLLDRFEVTLGRAQDGLPRTGSLALKAGVLSEQERATLRERVAHGVFVSEHLGLPRRAYLPALLQDRMAASVHVELLRSLLRLEGARVLELRPRLGSIGASLKHCGATVFGMPLFESQQFLIGEVYGIPVEHRLNYDRFTIPYEGEFDVIVANHVFTHCVRPDDVFATMRRRIRPGGHLYLYNEPDERDFTRDGKSIFNTLNAFHLQTFDTASFMRALRACGFEPVFITHHGGNLVALARRDSDAPTWSPMSIEERDRRLLQYRQARDAGILRLPDRLRGHFADEWDAVVERSFAAGLIDFDGSGHLRFVKTERASRRRSRTV